MKKTFKKANEAVKQALLSCKRPININQNYKNLIFEIG
jgi:hypothetical protein